MKELFPGMLLNWLIGRFEPSQVYLYSLPPEGENALLPPLLELAVVLAKSPSRLQSRKFNMELSQRLGRPAQVVFFEEEEFEKESATQGRVAYAVKKYGKKLYPLE